MSEQWESVAYWPIGTCGNGDVSTDTHDTRESAVHVCRLLNSKGFGGDGEIFPVKTEVRPSSPKQLPAPPSPDDSAELLELCEAALEQAENTIQIAIRNPHWNFKVTCSGQKTLDQLRSTLSAIRAAREQDEKGEA